MLVTDVANIAFGYGGHGILMAFTFKAHFDASGKEDNPVQTVGGYIASDSVCKAIEKEWKQALGGKGPFHLADFGTDSCKLGSGTWDLPTRVSFLKKLASIVNRPQGTGIIGVSVETGVYDSFLAKTELARVHGPAYSWCAEACVSVAENLLEKEGIRRELVAYIFEGGDRQHEIAKSVAEYERRNPHLRGKRSLHFLPKDTILLQPTDLIAGKIQEVLLRAYAALSCLDNGLGITPINRFERYYSFDGTSAPVMNQRAECFVANKPLLSTVDYRIGEMYKEKPWLLRKREKDRINQGKRSRPRTT